MHQLAEYYYSCSQVELNHDQEMDIDIKINQYAKLGMPYHTHVTLANRPRQRQAGCWEGQIAKWTRWFCFFFVCTDLQSSVLGGLKRSIDFCSILIFSGFKKGKEKKGEKRRESRLRLSCGLL